MAVSWPFDSTVTQDTQGNPIYSRTYSADVLAKFLQFYFRNGVLNTNNATALQVVSNEGMTVKVKAGAANINGRQFFEETDRVLTAQAANASLDRIDCVVLRLNLSVDALFIDLYIVPGTAASTPAVPSLTRNASIYEIGLANLFIAKNTTTISQERITDTRLDSARCGVVASIIGDTNTSTYYAQIAADLAAFKSTEQAAFAVWFAGVQATLGDDAAGNLLNLINQHAPQTFGVSVPASGWSESAPYTQTVAVTGILASDTPMGDVVLSATLATRIAQRESYGYISMITTAIGSITLTCDEDKPTADLTLALKVVR